MSGDEETDWGQFDSGPFCPHWSALGDCDVMCVCGHRCGAHSGEPFACRECACEDFKDD